MATLTFNKVKLIELLKEKRAKVLANSKKELRHTRQTPLEAWKRQSRNTSWN
jgi:hypothetical protein